MTYKQKAIELLSKYLGVDDGDAMVIVDTIADECEYKPCVFEKLNAPSYLDDWNTSMEENSIGFKISFYNSNHYGSEVLNLPITIDGKIVGVVTNVTPDEVIGCVWHKRAVIEAEHSDNEIIGFELVTQ